MILPLIIATLGSSLCYSRLVLEHRCRSVTPPVQITTLDRQQGRCRNSISKIMIISSFFKVTSMRHPYESKCNDKPLGIGVPYSRLGCIRKCQEEFVTGRCKCTNVVDTITNRKFSRFPFNCLNRHSTIVKCF